MIKGMRGVKAGDKARILGETSAKLFRVKA
jgi:hypothetical protein